MKQRGLYPASGSFDGAMVIAVVNDPYDDGHGNGDEQALNVEAGDQRGTDRPQPKPADETMKFIGGERNQRVLSIQ